MSINARLGAGLLSLVVALAPPLWAAGAAEDYAQDKAADYMVESATKIVGELGGQVIGAAKTGIDQASDLAGEYAKAPDGQKAAAVLSRLTQMGLTFAFPELGLTLKAGKLLYNGTAYGIEEALSQAQRQSQTNLIFGSGFSWGSGINSLCDSFFESGTAAHSGITPDNIGEKVKDVQELARLWEAYKQTAILGMSSALGPKGKQEALLDASRAYDILHDYWRKRRADAVLRNLDAQIASAAQRRADELRAAQARKDSESLAGIAPDAVYIFVTDASYGLYLGTSKELEKIPKCRFPGGGLDCSAFVRPHKTLAGPFKTMTEARAKLCESISERAVWPLGIGLKGQWRGDKHQWYGLWHESVTFDCPESAATR
ncbi:MAG: hypothetical protein HY921_05620 [Elusimicrobia bacterium]|nr:hypothetical protein [Elusimicrobiota bacterium]